MRSYLQIAAGAIGFLAVSLILGLALNYFNVLPASLGEPFKLLPQKSQTIPESLKTPASTQTAKKSADFPCPIKKEPCPLADVITSPIFKTFKGLGYKDLTNGTEVVSIMAGKYVSLGEKEDYVDLNITDQQKNLQVMYLFVGKSHLGKTGLVSERETIGTLSGKLREEENISNNHNVIIYIRDLQSHQLFKLSPSNEGILREE